MAKGLTDAQLDAMDEMEARQNLYGTAARVLESPDAVPMTDAQMDQRATSDSVMQATPFGQKTMPQSAPQLPQADFREPAKPLTDAELNAQEDNLYYDPAYEMPFEEFAPVHARRQQEKNTVGSFVDGAVAAGQGLVSLTAEMGQELKDNATSNFYRPDRFATQNFVTLKEGGRKAGLEFAKFIDWVGNTARDHATDVQRQEQVRGAIAQKLQAEGRLSGDLRGDIEIINREFAAAKERGETAPTPLEENADVEQAFEDYRRGKNFDREIAGVGNYNIGQTPVTQESSEARATNPITGEVMEPQRALATGASMALSFDNLLPVGAGVMSKARILRRLSSITGVPLKMTENVANAGADALQRGAMRITDRVQDLTGMNAVQQTAAATALTGGVGYLSTQGQGAPAALGGVATGVLSILPIMKFGGAILRRTGAAAGGGYAIVREMGAGGAGVAGAEAADAMAKSGVFPQRYARHMQPGGASADSTLRRVAQDPENPQMLRRLSRTANNLGATQAFRLADDAISSAAVSGLAAAPFALVAPDAEQGGQIVGGAVLLGTTIGTATRSFGRRPAEVDADIARMLVDVTESNGDAASLMSLSHDSLSQLAAMQGVLRNKVKLIPLRGQDYRANADLRAAGGETAAGLYVEKDAKGSARIFVNMGHTAPVDGTVSVRPDADKGGSVIDITAADGTVDSTHVPQGIRLLVKTGDAVSANQRLAQDLSPNRIIPHEIGHAILTSDILDGQPRNDLRNLVNQQYATDGVAARGREYATRLVDKDILVGAIEDAPVNLTDAQINDISTGKTTLADVMKGQPVSEQARQRLIDQRVEELSERSVENGQDPLDWARDEIIAETFASDAPAIDFRAIRRDAMFPRLAESILASGGRVLEVMGARLDPGTGKLLDNPSVLFRDNPLFQDRIMQKRVREYVRAYDQYLVGLEEAGTAAPRGVELARSNRPEDLGRSTHVKLRDEGRGVLENDFLFQRPDGTYSFKPQKLVNQTEASRAAQIKTLYDARKFVPVNSTQFGRRKVDGRETVGGPVLPPQFDFFTHFPQHVREFARSMEQSRAEGGSWDIDYNAIGTGASGRYRVTNLGNVRAIQRETVPFGWQVTKANHLLAASLDLNAFRASSMKAINKGDLGLFNNDMKQVEADLKTYLANHRAGFPGEATIGVAKRDMLNGLIGTGTAVQRTANPLYYELNPRGSIRTWRVDRLNDAKPTGRTGYFFDYDKINNNRMPQQIPRGAQGMPDAVDALTTDQLLRQYEENQGYLGLSTLGMREGRPVRGGAAQTRELLRRNDAISAELERRGVRSEDAQLQQALQRRGQAMPDAEARSGAVETLDQLRRSQFIPTKVAAEVVGGFPEYLRPVAQFITDQRQKLANGQMTRRDVMKAYTMTIASQGSGARAVEVIANNVAKDGVRFRPSKDFTTADKKGRAAIRPEEAAAYWLGTDAGQKALDNFEAGRFSPDDWKELVAIRKAYGDDRFNNLGAFNPDNIRTMDKVLADLNASRADTGKVMDAVQQLRGIKTGKKGFIAHLLGIGDVPTIDAVEINFWLTGKADIGKLNTRKATLARSVKESISDRRVSQEMFRRIDQRINALRDEVPGGASISQEVWSHVMHHWLWDKSKGIETTHEGMYRAQAQFMPDVAVNDEGGTVWRTLQDAPVITLKDLKGRKVFAAFADLTSAGKIYRGIDSSEIAVPVETHGGPEWPLLQAEKVGEETNVWSNQGAGVSAIKARRANEGAIMLVAAMDKNAHVSNTETATAVIATNAAYARDGRITPENLATLDNSIRREIEDFPGIESPSIMEYVNKLPFQGAKSRARIAEILESKKSQDLGAPNVQRILDEVRSDQYDGLRIGDAVLAIELTPGATAVKLGEQGTLKHPSYQYGLRGRVIGRFARPININSIFDDFYAQRRANGKPELGDRRAFDLAKPVQEITDAIASRIPGTPYRSFRSPRHAQLINIAKNDSWKSSEQTVKAGGVSPAAFIDALNASPAKLALDRYTLKGLQEKLEAGDMSIYQLADAQVFFGIKQGDPASAYGQDPAAFGFGPNEKTLSLVLNNERKTGGMADAIVMKSLQLGVTALDCFAVKSKKYPEGVLPTLYEAYGFESAGSLPFDPQFYSKTELADLKKYWKSTGWDEGLGLPEIVLMKWKGNNELRTKSLRELAEQGGQSFRGETKPIVRDTRSRSKSASNKRNQPKRRAGQGDAGSGAGSQGDAGRGVRLSRGFLGAYDELLSMSPDELRNLGIK